MKIGIIGNGYVGKATALLKCEDNDIIIYDKDSTKCEPPGTSIQDIIKELYENEY